MACIDFSRVCTDCADVENGRVRAVAFIRVDARIDDYYDEAFWAWLVFQKKAFIIHRTRGTYSAEPQTVEGWGAQPTELANILHTLVYTEPFVCDLTPFYNALSDADIFRVVMITENGLRYSNEPVSIKATAPVGATETVNEFSVTVTWNERNMPECINGTPPLFLRDCNYYNRVYPTLCVPCEPICVTNEFIDAFYTNDTYPTTPGYVEYDYTFENVPSYPIVALVQVSPAQLFLDTVDVVADGVVIASADPSRIGLSGIYSIADLIAASPLNLANYSQWATKFNAAGSWRVLTWYNDGISGGAYKTVKVYVRGYDRYIMWLFCPRNPYSVPPQIAPNEANNTYVVSEQTKCCLCPQYDVPPLTSELLLDGSPAPTFLALAPNTTYEYTLTGNFAGAGYERKICCGSALVMFVFIGSKLSITLTQETPGPFVLDGVTFTYDSLTYTLTVETPAVVTGLSFTGAASVQECGTHTYPIEMGECALPNIQFLPESETDVAGYMAANPSVNAAIPISAFGTGVTYLGLYDYQWLKPQTDTMTIRANIFAPNDRDPSEECCADYRPDFTSGARMEFEITSPCTGSFALVSQAMPLVIFENYRFQWQLGAGYADLVIKNLLDPAENPCDLTVRVQISNVCGLYNFREIDITMVSACSPTLDFISPDDGTPAAYLAANPSVDAVAAYDALNQLIYLGDTLGVPQYTWDTSVNNALLRCDITERAGTPLACCPNYTEIMNGETAQFQITSLCLSVGSIYVDFANPIASDNGYTFTFVNGPGYFGLTITNDNAPTPNPCVLFAITPTITLCPENVSDLSGPQIQLT